MSLAPYALLTASLVVLLISTRQLPFRWRSLTWLVGAGLLIASGVVASGSAHGFDILRLGFEHPDALLEALGRNWPTVGAAIGPLFVIFLALGGAIAILCLVAFTPGEAIEKAVRPINIALVGSVAGGLLALAIAGLGFGGAVKRQAYLGVIAEKDVHDGDTIHMGDVSLRLWGIEAPELKQPCLSPNEATPCGGAARAQLLKLVRGQLLLCLKPNDAEGDLREALGRPLVVCTRRSDRIDVNREMVRLGCADVFRDNGKVKSSYEPDIPAPGAPRACPAFEQPGDWRDHRRQAGR